MNKQTLQQLKMAWLAAREAGDTQTQVTLLTANPSARADLIDFIAAYHASGAELEQQEPMLELTSRAYKSALDRVFAKDLAFANLAALRKSRKLSKVEVAQGLRLGVDVWNKMESGAIELLSLSQRQLERLANFFQVGVDQFSTLLGDSQPALTLNRRQTKQAASQEQQPQKQSFAEALERSTMSSEDRQFWLDA
jgi:transcriptional regulator with XRE-family HTH domain